ncbi:FAD-linked oxidoreductase, partial [Micromonospora azadirachtae]
MAGTAPSTAPWSNWAGNQSGAATILRPGSVTDIVDAVLATRAAGGRIRVAGSGHSFTPIALADDRRMDLS